MRALITQFSNLPTPKDLHLNYQELSISPDDGDNLLRLSHGEHFTDNYLLAAQEKAVREGDQTNYYEKYNHVQIHAWRALAQLKKPEHIQHFIQLLEEEEDQQPFSSSRIFGSNFKFIMVHQYGSISLDHLVPYFYDARNDQNVTSIIVQTLAQMGHNPEARKTIIGIFVKYLDHSPSSRKVNAHVINSLVELQANETIQSIQNIFAAHLAELPICGDLESCEIKLGVKETRQTKAPSNAQLKKLENQAFILSRKEHCKSLLEDPSPYRTLEFFLEVYKSEQSLSSASSIEGLIIAALIQPNPISRLKLTPYIWDTCEGRPQHSPTWITPADKKSFSDALKTTYTNLNHLLAEQRIEPSLILENKTPSYALWVRGLIAGLDLWPSKKQDRDHHKHLINTASQVLRYEKGDEYSDIETKELFESLIQSIFRFKTQGEISSSHPTTTITTIIDTNTPRNAPCPCGSRKKYKRCCMN